MKEAIKRSGYVMEQRVFPIIEQMGYYVETNPVYPDIITGKSREYDFSATTGIQVYKHTDDFLFIHLIGECINNILPIVFFSIESPINFLFHQEIKYAGIPLYLHDSKNQGEFISLNDFFEFEKFHHYCRGTYSTQYCSFKKKKTGKDEKWMAFHDEEHHGIFNSLIGATRYSVDEWFSGWGPTEDNNEEPINLNLFYPLLILGGELFECTQTKGRLFIKKRNHIQFRKSFISDGNNETFQIDIVIENYLKKYLDIVGEEITIIKNRFRRRRKNLYSAIRYIVTQAKEQKAADKIKSFREVLEF